jgi:hypothetical protein
LDPGALLFPGEAVESSLTGVFQPRFLAEHQKWTMNQDANLTLAHDPFQNSARHCHMTSSVLWVTFSGARHHSSLLSSLLHPPPLSSIFYMADSYPSAAIITAYRASLRLVRSSVGLLTFSQLLSVEVKLRDTLAVVRDQTWVRLSGAAFAKKNGGAFSKNIHSPSLEHYQHNRL